MIYTSLIKVQYIVLHDWQFVEALIPPCLKESINCKDDLSRKYQQRITSLREHYRANTSLVERVQRALSHTINPPFTSPSFWRALMRIFVPVPL